MYFHIFRNKQIIRTRPPQGRTGSDYIGLVPVAGVEPARCRHQRILSPSRLPIPSYRHLWIFFIIPNRKKKIKRKMEEGESTPKEHAPKRAKKDRAARSGFAERKKK